MIRSATIALLLLATASTALPPPELATRIARETPAGCTVYWLFVIQLYRAELWSDAATLPGEEFGLSLIYKTPFSREQLVEASVAEMARISGRPVATFATTRTELEAALHPVQRGDRYTAWRDSSGQVSLSLNGTTTGTLTQDGDLFLDIWLGPQTRYPQRRKILLAGTCRG